MPNHFLRALRSRQQMFAIAFRNSPGIVQIAGSERGLRRNGVDFGAPNYGLNTSVRYEKMDDKRLRPGADAAGIHEAFAMRAAHASRTEVARRLDETAPRPNGGRWTPSMVDRIIRNRVYMGHAYRGGRVNSEAHQPIVTAAANAAPVRAAARGQRPNLLSGIVRCAACRYVLAPGVSGMGPTQAGVPSYRCRGTHTAGVCPVERRPFHEVS